MIDQSVKIGRYVAVGAVCLAIGAYSASEPDRLSWNESASFGPTESDFVRPSLTHSDSVRLVQAPVKGQVVPIEAKVRGHLTTSELAKVLNCSTRHVVRMIHEGAIPGKQESEGKSWEIPLSVLVNVESPSNL